MVDQPSEVETLDAAIAKQRWDDLVRRVGGGGSRALIEEGGRPTVALISARDLRRLLLLEAKGRADFAGTERMQDDLAAVPHAEPERAVDQADAATPEDCAAVTRPAVGSAAGTSPVEALAATQAAFRGVPDAEIEREVEQALAAVRARRRRDDQ